MHMGELEFGGKSAKPRTLSALPQPFKLVEVMLLWRHFHGILWDVIRNHERLNMVSHLKIVVD